MSVLGSSFGNVTFAQAPQFTAAVRKPLAKAAAPSGGFVTAKITGKVVDPSGNPIAGATFKINNVVMTTVGPSTPGTRRVRVPLQTDATGVFSFSRNPGKATLEISAPGYQTASFPDVEWVANTTTDAGTITLTPGESEVKAEDTGRSWLKYALIAGGVLVVGVGGFIAWRMMKKRQAVAGLSYVMDDEECNMWCREHGRRSGFIGCKCKGRTVPREDYTGNVYPF